MPAFLLTRPRMSSLYAWIAAVGPQTAIIVGIIVVLTALSVAFLGWEAAVFGLERRRLAALRARLEDQDPPAASPEEWMKTALAELPARGYVRDRVEDIHELTRQQAAVDLPALSDLAVERSETSVPHNLARFSLLALLIIGLAGTFLALSTTLTTSQLDKVAENGSFDADRYQQAVHNIYSGFGGAFTNSIAAIICTVGLLFLQNVIVRPVKDGFFNKLDAFTQVRLLPFCLSGRQEPESLVFAAVSKLEAVVVGFRAVSRQLGEAVTKSDGASQQLGEVAQTLADAVRSFTETVGSQSGFQVVMERLYDTISRSEQRTGEMLTEFSGVAATVQEENVTLARMQEAMADFQKSTVATHRDFLAGVDSRSQRAAETLHTRQTKDQKALVEAAAGMQAAINGLRPTLEAVQTSLQRDGERQTLAKLDTTLNRVGETLATLNETATHEGEEGPTAQRPARGLLAPPVPPEQTALLSEVRALTAEMRRFFVASTTAAVAPPEPPVRGWGRLRRFLPGS